MGAYLDQELLFRTCEIAYRHKITEIIETGTHDGHSSMILSQVFHKVHTIENIPEFYEMAKNNLEHINNITQYLGDSTEVLKEIINPNDNFIFFLDAHSNIDKHNHSIVQDELKIIKSKGILPPVIIHDFYVPNFFDGGTTSRFPSLNGFTIEWLWNDLVNLYGENNFHYYYNVCPTSEFTGVLFVEPLLNKIN